MQSRRLQVAAVVLLALAVLVTVVVAFDRDGSDAAPRGSTSTAPRVLASDGANLKETDGLFHGTYVGRAASQPALIAVEAAQPSGDGERLVTVFVCDGRRIAEFFPAAVSGNEFTLRSRDDDTTVEGVVAADEVTGTIRFGKGRTVSFALARAAGAAGLYDLAVDDRGAISGGTDHGVGATGRTALAAPGAGHLDLADGRRVAFRVRSAAGLSAGGADARMIVLGNGRVAGVVRREGGAVGLLS